MRLSLTMALVALAVGHFPTPARCADDKPATPEAQVDKLFERFDKTTSPGCAVAVIQDGRIVYKRGYGMADLDHDAIITPASVFHVASVSKQFTAFAILLLAQQGKVSLDDEVRKHVPELADFGGKITIRHLIHHTSGLRDQWSLLGLAGWRYSLDLITDDDVLELVSKQADLNFRPGEKHLYSNTGYTLLAQIVKRVSGQSFREFTSANIFEPLGMKNTHFRDDHAEVVKGQAYGYAPAKDGAFRLSITNFDTVGATSLLTTVEDLALWDRNFYEKRVGGAALIGQMLEPGKLNNGEQLKYAFGLTVDKYKGLPIVDHGGADAGYRADLLRFPGERFSVACLCNLSTSNPGDLARRIADTYLAKELKPPEAAAKIEEPAVTLSEQQLSRWTGLYWNRDGDRFRRIELKEGKLRLVFPETSIELQPLSEDRFRPLGQPPVRLRFAAATPGGPARLEQSVVGGSDKPDSFEAVKPFTPAPQQLGEYAGAYQSPEMDAIYRMAVEKEKLVLKRSKSKPANLEPQVQDVFIGEPGAFRFLRDSSGRVSGFILNSGRILNFRFDKK